MRRPTGLNRWTPFVQYLHLSDVSSLTQSLLFADDTNIFCSHRNTDHNINERAK